MLPLPEASRSFRGKEDELDSVLPSSPSHSPLPLPPAAPVGPGLPGRLPGHTRRAQALGSVTAERAGHTRPSPSPPPRPRTFFAAHDLGASARTRRDRSRRADRSSPDSEERYKSRRVSSSTGPSSSWVAAATGSRAFPQPSATEQPEPRSSLDHAHFRRGPPEPRRERRFSSVHFRPRTLPACVPETRVPGAHPQPRAFPACQALAAKMKRPRVLWRRGAGRAWSSAGWLWWASPQASEQPPAYTHARRCNTPACPEVLVLASVSPSVKYGW